MLNQEQISQVLQLMQEVGEYQLKEQKKLKDITIKEKGLNQLVSYVDVNSEKRLVSGLSEITPGTGFLTEEATVDPEQINGLQWIIDPLDGTTNYLFGHSLFAISIALLDHGKTVFGAVSIPAQKSYYTATPEGAFLNGVRIKIAERDNIKDSLIATGFPYYTFKEIDDYLLVLRELMQTTKGLRRMGSAAIDLAYTAEGRFDGFFELNLSPWDVAAGAYLIKQAGGTVTDFRGEDNFIFGNSILGGSKSIYPELKSIIDEHIKL